MNISAQMTCLQTLYPVSTILVSYPQLLGQQTLAKTSPSVTLWGLYSLMEFVLPGGVCTLIWSLYLPVEFALPCGVVL